MISMKSDFSGLEKVKKRARTPYVTRVGILGKTDARDDGLSNAEIGFKQEFGSITENIPIRSFLRMPLMTKSAEILNLFESKFVQKQVEKKGIRELFVLAGIKAEAIIQEAFSTRGFGSWKKNAPLTIFLKGSDSPLIDTGELAKSITSEVIKK